MRNLVAALLLGSAPLAAWAQTSIPVPLADGQVYEMTIETTKAAEGAEGQAEKTFSSTSEISVAEAGDGFVYTIRTTDFDLSQLDPMEAASLEAMLSQFLDRPIEFEADSNGRPTKLRDWQALSEDIAKGIKESTRQLLDERMKDVPEEAQDRLRGMIWQMTDNMTSQMTSMSAEEAAVAFGEDLNVWSWPNGTEWTEGEPRTAEIELPSPMGPQILPATETAVLTAAGDGLATIERSQELSEEGTEALVEGLIAMVGIPEAQQAEAREAMSAMPLGITYRQTFTTDTETGLTTKVVNGRETALGPQVRQTETKIIEVAPKS